MDLGLSGECTGIGLAGREGGGVAEEIGVPGRKMGWSDVSQSATEHLSYSFERKRVRGKMPQHQP